MHQFNETHPAFAGFSQYYHREIFPQLVTWEGKRKHKRFWAIPAMCLSVICCAIILYWSVTTSFKLSSYIVVCLLLFTNPLTVYHFFFKDFEADLKRFLVSKVCRFTGLKYSKKKTNSWPPIEMFRSFRFFPRSYGFGRFEDHMEGSFKGVSFDIVEAHGMVGHQKNRRKHTTAIFRFNLPEFSEGKFVVLRKGDRKPDKKLNLKPVGFAAPPFSHLFEVYGDDQIISRFLLHPIFLERILYAERVIDGINARFAFTGGVLWVCVETANRFEQGSMWTSFINPRRTQLLIWEVASVLKIVDGLVDLLRKPGRLTPYRKPGIAAPRNLRKTV